MGHFGTPGEFRKTLPTHAAVEHAPSLVCVELDQLNARNWSKCIPELSQGDNHSLPLVKPAQFR
jgi:hypothetical protein